MIVMDQVGIAAARKSLEDWLACTRMGRRGLRKFHSLCTDGGIRNRFIGVSHLSGQTENGCQQTKPRGQQSMALNAHEAEWVLARAIILQ
jgi:hypothetical protein